MPIFDQGYQHWNGKLTSQAWRWWAITRHSVRMQLRSKLVKLLMVSCFGPALALVLFIILWSLFDQGNTSLKTLLAFFRIPQQLLDAPDTYRKAVWTLAFHFFFYVQYFLLMLLVMLVGPNLISKDIRFNALPLYLSRPLRRWEYFFGKLGVIAFFVFAVTAGPAMLAWVLGILFSLKLSIITELLPLLGGILMTSLIISLIFGLWMLALSSLTRNSRYVSIMWFAWWLLTNMLWVMLFIASGYEEWSCLASFTKNVQRVQEALLDTETAWQQLDEGYRIIRSKLPGGNMVEQMSRNRRGGPLNVERIREKPADDRIAVLTMYRNGKEISRGRDIRSLYPWQWSAGMLVLYGVVSLCILTTRVKSLDRLR
jgi:ABC-2 type transport system permease protein